MHPDILMPTERRYPSVMGIPTFQNSCWNQQTLMFKRGKLVYPLCDVKVSWTKKQLYPISLFMMVKTMVSRKISLEGDVLDQMLSTNNLEFCFNLASIVTFMTPAWSAAVTFKILVELSDGSLTPSVSIWGCFGHHGG